MIAERSEQDIPPEVVRLSLFAEAEKEAHKHKWIQSEKAGHDLGDAALAEWHANYWRTFYRERWLQHLRGEAFWQELGARDWNLLARLPRDPEGLVDRVVEQVAAGAENLQVIEWARGQRLRIADVLPILHALDVNAHRLPSLAEMGDPSAFTAGIHARHRPRALVAEGDDGYRDELARTVRGEGVEVSATGTGEAALDVAQQRRFDLFLLDVGLSDKTGAEVAWYLQRHGVTAPIVAIVDPAGRWQEDDLYDCGFTRLLPRPVDPVALRTLARETVDAVQSGGPKAAAGHA